MVVEEALGDVQQLLARDAHLVDFREQRLEVARVRLVGADVLGGQDRVELNSQPPVAAGEGLPVDVREDDQLVALLQPLQRLRRIGEGRPFRDRGADLHREPLGNIDAVCFPGRDDAAGDDLRIAHVRVLALGGRLGLCVSLQERVEVWRLRRE